MSMAMEEGNDLISGKGIPKGIEIFLRPIIFWAKGMEVEGQDNGFTGITDTLLQVILQEFQAGTG